MWTIYTFGDGDLIVQLLRAIALLVNGGLGSLIHVASLIGLAVLLAMTAAGSIEIRHVLSWLMAIVVLANLLISIRTQVAVEDVIDSRIPPQVVGDVPYLVALPASLASEASYRLTLLATSLQLNGEMGNGLSILRPTSNLQALLESELTPGDLRANLINYLHVCVAHPGSGLSHTDIANRPDLFAAIASQSVAVYLPVIQNGEENGSLTCANFYTQILVPRLSPIVPQSDTGLAATVNHLSCKVVGGRQLINNGSVTPCRNLESPSLWNELDGSLQALHLTPASLNSQTVFTTVIIAKLWRLAEIDVARGQYDTASAIAIANDGLIKQLEVQSKTGQLVNRNGLFRQIRALADGMVYLGGPILIVFAMTPLVWKAMALYLRLFAWLAIWGPLQAVANFIVLGVAVSDLTGLAIAQNGAAGVTMANLPELYIRVVQANALGYDVMIAIPAIALVVAWGGVGALGSVLSGASGQVASVGREQLARVESGQEVMASTLSRGSILSSVASRPHFPGLYALSSATSSATGSVGGFSDWYQNAAVTHGTGGATVATRQGELVSARRDGSLSVTSPTRQLSMAPDGSLFGTMRADTGTVVPGLGPVAGGSIVQFTGNGAMVQEPSSTDPVTGRSVTPTAYYARDTQNPDGQMKLVSREWTLTQGGLTYKATQGPDTNIFYRVTGRTDGAVQNPDGSTTPATMNIDFGVLTDSAGKPIGPWQGTSSYLTSTGERSTGEGRLENIGAPDGPTFVPYVSHTSNQQQSDITAPIVVAGTQGTVTTHTITGSDGSRVTSLRVALENGLIVEGMIPQKLVTDSDGTVSATVSIGGFLRNVRIKTNYGGYDGIADIAVPHTPATIKLPADWWALSPDAQYQALGTAIQAGTLSLRPFSTKLPDPADPTRTMELTINSLQPPSPPMQLTTSLTADTPSGERQAVGGSPSPAAFDRWIAFASNITSTSTLETVLQGGRGLKGNLSVQGPTEIRGDTLTGSGVMYFIDQNGARFVLGAGQAQAKLTPSGWEVVSAQLNNGVNLTQGSKIEISGVRAIAPGVFAYQTGVADLSTGEIASQKLTVGVTSGNVAAVNAMFGTSFFKAEPGGELVIENNRAVTYRGPATVTIQTPDDAGRTRSVSVPGVANLQGRYDPQSRSVTMQGGTVSQTTETSGSTAFLPTSVRQFFEQFGHNGAVNITVGPDGKALYVQARGGQQLSLDDTRHLDVGTFNVAPASAFTLAAVGSPRLADAVFAAGDRSAQDQRAWQIISAITQWSDRIMRREGVSLDAFSLGLGASGGLKLDRPGRTPAKPGTQPGATAPPSHVPSPYASGGLEVGGRGSYESRDQVTLDLVAQRLWAGYHRAQEQARRGGTLDRQAFVETLSAEWQGVLKQEVLNKLELSPWAFGVTAVPNRALNEIEHLFDRRQGQSD